MHGVMQQRLAIGHDTNYSAIACLGEGELPPLFANNPVGHDCLTCCNHTVGPTAGHNGAKVHAACHS